LLQDVETGHATPVREPDMQFEITES
jgi:hypothetical protein